MSFQIKEFTTIRLLARDVTKSRDWYKALFDIEPIYDSKDFVTFKICGVNLDIASPDDKNPHSSGGSIGYWLVDDLDAVLKKVQALGGTLYRGPLRVAETGRTILQVQDPFGNVIGFEAP